MLSISATTLLGPPAGNSMNKFRWLIPCLAAALGLSYALTSEAQMTFEPSTWEEQPTKVLRGYVSKNYIARNGELYDEDIHALSGHDVVLLVDKSSSMKERDCEPLTWDGQ